MRMRSTRQRVKTARLIMTPGRKFVVSLVVACIFAAMPTIDHASPGPSTPSPSPPSAKKLVQACGKKPSTEKFQCYERLLLEIVGSGGVEAAMDILVVTGLMDTDVQRDGHVYAHAIGIAAYERSHDVGDTFTRCSELFQSGCYHGVVQAYLDETLDLADDTGQLDAICA